MIPEQLLLPRYKVIANYPHCPYKVGDLVSLNLNVPYPSFLCTITKDHDDVNGRDITSNNWQQLKEIEIYPHLFRLLKWWEERKAEDMPAYVKYVENGFIAKVDHFDLVTTSAWFMYLEGGVHPYSPGGSALENTHWLPATEAEYNAYLNSK